MTETAPKFQEYLKLLWLNITVKKQNLIEYFKVIYRYYGNFGFLKADTLLLSKYLFKNPFKISKEFLIKKGESDIYAYGETPLTTLEYIAKECGITAKDTVFELGCGRGRGCFWLNRFIGCKVVGIEIIPEFVSFADQVKNSCQIKNIEFRQGDILEADYTEATVLYLYGTCYEDLFIKKLIKRIASLPSGAKIITISYPLSDYIGSRDFEIMKRFTASFTWGVADVYLQIKK